MRTYVVIGMGSFGRAVATKLFSLGNEVMIIDENQFLVSQVANYVTHAVVGDASDESVLRGLGVHNYDCAIVCIGKDLAASVLITLNLKELGMKQVICKATDESQRKALLKIGADRVVIPEQEMAARLAKGLSSANVLDYIDLSEEYGIAEIGVPGHWVGKTLSELEVRGKYRVDILGVKQNEDIRLSLGAGYVFQQDDILLALGRNADLARLQKI